MNELELLTSQMNRAYLDALDKFDFEEAAKIFKTQKYSWYDNPCPDAEAIRTTFEVLFMQINKAEFKTHDLRSTGRLMILIHRVRLDIYVELLLAPVTAYSMCSPESVLS